MEALTIDNVNLENYTFKIKNVDGKYQTKIVNKTNGSPLIIKTPWLIIPFLPSSYAKKNGATENITDWTLSAKASCYQTLALTDNIQYDYEKNKNEIEKLFKLFDDLNEKALDFAQENSQKLFKKELDRNFISKADYVTKIIKSSTKKDNDGNFYPSTFTTKIMKDIKSSMPSLVIEDLEGKSIPIESWDDIENKLSQIVTPGTPARLIIQVRTYLVKAIMGFSIKLCAVQVDDKKKNNMNNVFTFSDPPSKTEKPKKSEEQTHDSDEEQNSEVEVE